LGVAEAAAALVCVAGLDSGDGIHEARIQRTQGPNGR
jgi:hypothetical protein